jgi:hypothetical protein
MPVVSFHPAPESRQLVTMSRSSLDAWGLWHLEHGNWWNEVLTLLPVVCSG